MKYKFIFLFLFFSIQGQDSKILNNDFLLPQYFPVGHYELFKIDHDKIKQVLENDESDSYLDWLYYRIMAIDATIYSEKTNDEKQKFAIIQNAFDFLKESLSYNSKLAQEWHKKFLCDWYLNEFKQISQQKFDYLKAREFYVDKYLNGHEYNGKFIKGYLARKDEKTIVLIGPHAGKALPNEKEIHEPLYVPQEYQILEALYYEIKSLDHLIKLKSSGEIRIDFNPSKDMSPNFAQHIAKLHDECAKYTNEKTELDKLKYIRHFFTLKYLNGFNVYDTNFEGYTACKSLINYQPRIKSGSDKGKIYPDEKEIWKSLF